VIRLRPLEIFILAILSVPSRAQDHEAVEYARRYAVGQKSMSVENRYVPDRATAIRIAVAVLIPIYGQAIEKKEAPWNAELKDDIWTVVGAFHGRAWAERQLFSFGSRMEQLPSSHTRCDTRRSSSKVRRSQPVDPFIAFH
jgi:hypothetical protein